MTVLLIASSFNHCLLCLLAWSSLLRSSSSWFSWASLFLRLIKKLSAMCTQVLLNLFLLMCLLKNLWWCGEVLTCCVQTSELWQVLMKIIIRIRAEEIWILKHLTSYKSSPELCKLTWNFVRLIRMLQHQNYFAIASLQWMSRHPMKIKSGLAT